MPPSAIDPATRALLDRFGFRPEVLASLVAKLATGDADNAIRGEIAPPAEGDVVILAERGTPERARLTAIGERAIAAGKVGAVILAGGMATRFGGVVKAAVPAVLGRSFLDLKVTDLVRIAERTGGRVPCYLMTSFATDERVRELGAALATDRVSVETFAQGISLRVTRDGEPFVEADGNASPYAPGHGDLSFALRESGVMKRFRDGGGEILVMSNVDNLGATLDPAILGLHIERGVAVTAEVVRKEAGDKGGAPARVGNTVQIVESFRFPVAFDQDAIPVFNTNTFVLDAAAIDRDFDLTWFVVEKAVEGKKVVQFERLVGELTAHLPSAFVEVARHGEDGRFQPAKDPQELARRAPEIEALLRARGVISLTMSERSVRARVGAGVRLALAVCLLVGCGNSGDVHILGGACPFGAESHLFDLDGPVLDGIAVAALDGGAAYVVWSERSGVFGVALDHEGHADGTRTRIGPACTAGVDVLADGARTLIACAIEGDVERGDRGAVVVYARDAQGVRVIDRRAGVGEGHGVALARGPSSVVLGWQDATGSSSAAWLATVGDASDPIRLSRGGFRSTAPAIAFEGDTRLVVWGESWTDEHGDAAGRVELQAGNRGPRVVSTLAYDLALPSIVPDPAGPILTLRDRRPRGSRPALQLSRVSADVRELQMHTGAPANAAGGAVAVGCQGGVMVVAPRTHSRAERLVSVRRHGVDLEGLGPEQQIYEHAATYEWADAVCLGDRLLVVFGSRSAPQTPVGTVRSVTVDCAAAAE